MAPVLNKSCCGCCSLEAGTFIIALLGLFGSIGGIVKGTIALSAINLNKYQYSRFTREESMEMFLNIIYLSFSVIHLIISVVLILSLHKRRAVFAIPWLVEMIIVILASFALFGYLMFNFIVKGIFVNVWIWATILFASIGLHIYYWLIVFSYHQKVIQLEKELRIPSSTGNKTEMML